MATPKSQLFEFSDESLLLGTVREVDTRKVSVFVKTDEDLRKAKVGQLVCLEVPSAASPWLIGIIDKVIKSVAISYDVDPSLQDEEVDTESSPEGVINTVKLTLVGSAKWDSVNQKASFSRSLIQVPDIQAKCFVLKEKQLQQFMDILVSSGNKEHSLELGRYTLDDSLSAIAYLDGNKFFQRHAALLGSTGSGKSWTVASILERAATLPSSNLVVFDLHGEYRSLSYARHIRVPGPEDLGKTSTELLYLPYWLLNADEMQAMFVDRSEFSAHNQVMAFQEAVITEKMATLETLKKDEVKASFTLDSPIPFEINNVVNKLKQLNEEMVPGATAGKEKQGPFFGQFSRFLTRIQNKLNDKRYGFLFKSPASENEYESMANLVTKLMDFSEIKSQIKVIDFSEVPSDILPVIVGLVARIIYQVQFWTDYSKRRPLVLVCDEAHLYLPIRSEQNPAERRAVEAFEKIAKEGRKYGVTLFIVSQRPSDVSTTILSQCNNVIALRLSNSDDQSTVKKLMPDSLESLLDILPIMDIGEALVVGDSVLLPSRVKINIPNEKPLSATIDFWSEWQKKIEKPDFIKAVENMRRQGRSE